MRHRYGIIAIYLLICCTAYAQQVKKVSFDYSYYPPDTQSLADAKRVAVERAQIQAIAEEFGVVLTQNNSSMISNNNETTNISFNSFSESEVKGEWIETTSGPEFKIEYDNGMMLVNVHIEGRVREIISAYTDFKVAILRNGTEPKFEDLNFRQGDNLFVRFTSPVSGNLAIYLLDENEEAFCLLPYSGMTNGIFHIKANMEYLLFSSEHPSEDVPSAMIEELSMICDKQVEHNQFYIIFSPNKFVKASDIADNTDDGIDQPRHTDAQSFHKWLAQCRKHDKEMRVDKVVVTISK